MLIHAGVADRTMWSEHLEPLAAAGYRVIALDLPGFGDAPPFTGATAPHEDVLATLDALHIDHAVFVGNSFGGAVVLRVAATAPERVAALVLISAPVPGRDPSEQLQDAWEAEEAALEDGDVDGALEAIVEAWTLPDGSAAIRDRIRTMQRRALAIQAAGAAPVQEPSDPLEAGGRNALERVTAPALVIAGGHDMPDFREGAAELARLLPDSRVQIIEAAGHLAPLEAPRRWRELVLDFLAEALSTQADRAAGGA